MLNVRYSATALLVAVLALAACGKKADDSAPLAFVPSDTPFVVANSESVPDATIDAWARQMQGVWPVIIGMYEKMLGELPVGDEPDMAKARSVVRAILDEIRQRDTPAKWAEIGFSQKARAAFYGIGLVPVMRAELGDPDAFRAMIARVEAAAGATLGTSRLGDHELRTFAIGETEGIIALQGKHLVLTLLPANADEPLKRAVLGLERPASNLAEGGELLALDKAERYVPHGSGWLDLRRIVALVDNDPGYAAFARLLDHPPGAFDAECRAEVDAMVAQAPRIVFGYRTLEAQRMGFSSRLELAPALAQSLMKLSAPPPGSAAPAGSLYDLSLSMPVLKIKDFLIERVDAVLAAPFRCPALLSWNERANELKTQLGQFVPPPISDFTGLRITIDRLAFPADGAPDFSGNVLVATSNPMAIVGLAQLAVPGLKDVTIAPDGKPVTLPAGVVPNDVGFAPQVQVAVDANALAIGSGTDSNLVAYLAAPAAKDGQLLRAAYSGRFYDTIGALMTRFASMLPEKDRANVEQQQALYAMYARWIRTIDLHINATPQGLEMHQEVELNP